MSLIVLAAAIVTAAQGTVEEQWMAPRGGTMMATAAGLRQSRAAPHIAHASIRAL